MMAPADQNLFRSSTGQGIQQPCGLEINLNCGLVPSKRDGFLQNSGSDTGNCCQVFRKSYSVSKLTALTIEHL